MYPPGPFVGAPRGVLSAGVGMYRTVYTASVAHTALLEVFWTGLRVFILVRHNEEKRPHPCS